MAGGAYAGHGAARNNPALEGEHGACDANGKITAGGPLPGGKYRLAAFIADGHKLGPNVIHLLPDDVTRARIVGLGRDADSFYLHGDNAGRDASEGCIIAPPAIRFAMWGSSDHDVEVV